MKAYTDRQKAKRIASAPRTSMSRSERKSRSGYQIEEGLLFIDFCTGARAPGAASYFDGHLAAMELAWKVPSGCILPSAMACALSRKVSGSGSLPDRKSVV